MTWRAIDELGPAFEATKRLLLPFDPRRWLVLAVIAFFVSGVSGTNPDFSTTAWDVPRDAPPVDLTPPPVPEVDLAVVLLAIALVVVFGLVAMVVGAIMEFVFVRVVSDRDVRLRGYVSANLGNGVSLFLFRLALVVVLGALVVLPALLLLALSPLLFLLAAVLLVPVLLVAAIGLWLVLRFTADFVVPVMLVEEVGILDAWRSFWPALASEWRQFGVYAIARLLLGFVAGVIAGVGFVVVGIALAIPFGIVALVLYLVLEVALAVTAVTVGVLVVLGILFVVSVFVVGMTLVQVPIQTYLRYYSLFVLGSVTPAFDMVGPLRAAGVADSDDHGSSERPSVDPDEGDRSDPEAGDLD